MSPGKNNRWNQWPTNASNVSRKLKFMSDVSKSPSLVKSEPLLPIGSELKANGPNGPNRRNAKNAICLPVPDLLSFMSPDEPSRMSTFGHPKSPMLNDMTDQRDPVTRMVVDRQARYAFQLGEKLQEHNSQFQGRTTSEMPQRNYSVQNQNNRARFLETDLYDEMDDVDDEDLNGENLNGRFVGTGNKSSDFATNPSTPRQGRPARSKSAQPFMSTFGQARNGNDYEKGPQIIREIHREIVPMYYGQAPTTPIEPFYGAPQMFSQGYMIPSGPQSPMPFIPHQQMISQQAQQAAHQQHQSVLNQTHPPGLPLPVHPFIQHQQMMQHHAQQAGQQQHTINLNQARPPCPQRPVPQYAPYYISSAGPMNLQRTPIPYSNNGYFVNLNGTRQKNGQQQHQHQHQHHQQQQQQQVQPKTIMKSGPPQLARQPPGTPPNVAPSAQTQIPRNELQPSKSKTQIQVKKGAPEPKNQQQEQQADQQLAEPRRNRRRGRAKNGARSRCVSEPQNWRKTTPNPK